MNGSQSQSRSIEDILKLIQDGNLLLPEFQRDFKWPVEKSETLFDSLFQDLFIGSLIISKPKFDLACKGFDLRPRGSKTHKPKPKAYTAKDFDNNNLYTLLDGQQRITSLYRALEGIDNIYVILKSPSVLSQPHFYDSIKNEVVCGMYDIVSGFDSVKPTNGCFYLKISDMYHATKSHMRDSKIESEFLIPTFDECNLISSDRALLTEFSLVLFKFFSTDIVKKANLLSVQLLDMDLEKFCLYFERSNSQGLTLSFTDIVTAKVYTEFKLGEHITQAKQENPSHFSETFIDGLVRYINYKANGEVTKASILKELKGTDFKKYWDVCVEDLIFVQKMLVENDWVFSIKDIPYRTMLFPIISFYQNIPHKDFTQVKPEQLNQLKFWFYSSLLDFRYGGARHGSTNVVLKKDCEKLENLAKGINIPAEYWQEIRVEYSYDELLRMDGNSNAKSIGIQFYLWSKNPFKHLENKLKVSFSTNVDVHHIFPVNYIRNNFRPFGKSDEFDISDTILNKIRINKISNIKIGDKSPSKYLNEILDKNKDLTSSLESHIILDSEKLLKGDYDLDFKAFLQKRYTDIAYELEPLKIAWKNLCDGRYTDIWKL